MSRGEFVEYLADASVLVTGAGGSIGAELCARLVGLRIRELVLVDQSEAALAGLARTLADDLDFPAARPVLADIKSRTRMAEVFERHRPDVVFHAAAYKHVPLLEASPVEGVATNVLGTKWTVEAARRAGVARFVLFSTDKAVQPTSVLGQTKAIAEWIVGAAGGESSGSYAAVRFGNVVDSAGSVLPIFRRQVARGGPLTVTHREATRYLMTAGEAAGLAIVAGGLAGSKDVFWLDLGPPVSVLDVARRLAAASSRDVAIDYIGLRDGERLHEFPFSSGDEIAATQCERVWSTALRRVDAAWLNGWLLLLARHVQRGSAAGIRAALAQMHATWEREDERPSVALAR